MAQVTLSGGVTAGFQSSTDASNVKSKGFGFDGSSIKFAATEDLGGGLKVAASLSLDNMGEGDAPAGNGTTLSVMGGFGALTFSDVEGSDYLPVDGLTANGNGTVGDRVTYNLPTFVPGLSATVSYKDGGAANGFGANSETTTSTAYVVGYKTGPISLTATSLKMTKQAAAASLQGRTYFKAGYDFGVASVTYGVINSDNGTSADNKETGLTVSAPLGAITATLAMSTSKNDGAVKRKGNSLKVSYALSKRSDVAFYTESYDNATAGANKVKQTSLVMNHSF